MSETLLLLTALETGTEYRAWLGPQARLADLGITQAFEKETNAPVDPGSPLEQLALLFGARLWIVMRKE